MLFVQLSHVLNRSAYDLNRKSSNTEKYVMSKLPNFYLKASQLVDLTAEEDQGFYDPARLCEVIDYFVITNDIYFMLLCVGHLPATLVLPFLFIKLFNYT